MVMLTMTQTPEFFVRNRMIWWGGGFQPSSANDPKNGSDRSARRMPFSSSFALSYRRLSYSVEQNSAWGVADGRPFGSSLFFQK